MGYAVAQAARDRGADVVLVSGPVNLAAPPGVRRISVECAQQMHDAVMAEIAGTDVFIGTPRWPTTVPLNLQAARSRKSATSSM